MVILQTIALTCRFKKAYGSLKKTKICEIMILLGIPRMLKWYKYILMAIKGNMETIRLSKN